MKRGKVVRAGRAVFITLYAVSVALTVLYTVRGEVHVARFFNLFMWISSGIVAADLFEEVIT